MGKPYDHTYYFAGMGCTAGAMICDHCNQPIFKEAHDWLSYKQSKGGDWGFVTFHRKCREDQSGWLKMEAGQRAHQERNKAITKAIDLVCRSFGITREDIVDLLGDAK